VIGLVWKFEGKIVPPMQCFPLLSIQFGTCFLIQQYCVCNAYTSDTRVPRINISGRICQYALCWQRSGNQDFKELRCVLLSVGLFITGSTKSFNLERQRALIINEFSMPPGFRFNYLIVAIAV
jgi:hypothetical protein